MRGEGLFSFGVAGEVSVGHSPSFPGAPGCPPWGGMHLDVAAPPRAAGTSAARQEMAAVFAVLCTLSVAIWLLVICQHRPLLGTAQAPHPAGLSST